MTGQLKDESFVRQVSMHKRTCGEVFGPLAHVFGNELGERIGSIKPAWRKTCN